MDKEITIDLSNKQAQALDLLNDSITTEVFYGGGAGGGKSFLGCYWVASSCALYPGTRYLVGRAHLKTLKESTLHTLFSVLRLLGLKSG